MTGYELWGCKGGRCGLICRLVATPFRRHSIGCGIDGRPQHPLKLCLEMDPSHLRRLGWGAWWPAISEKNIGEISAAEKTRFGIMLRQP